jgi:hypothetical protein
MASRGENVSRYFTNQFTVVRAVRRVNVDVARDAEETDWQAVIQTLLDRALKEQRANIAQPMLAGSNAAFPVTAHVPRTPFGRQCQHRGLRDHVEWVVSGAGPYIGPRRLAT